MARTHGFRVFVVQAFENRIKGKTALDVSWGSHAAQQIVELLDEVHARNTHFFVPAVAPKDGEPEKPTATLTVDPLVAIRDGLVHVQVSAGEMGSHRHATRPGRKPTSLKKRSAEAEHFVAFVFPKVSQDRFLIVTQTIRRRDPIERLLARMKQISYEQKKAAQEANTEARKAARLAKVTPPPKETHTKLVFDRRQAADDAYLDQIVAGAKKATAVFTGYAPNARGEAEQVERTLRVNLLVDEDLKASARVSRRWLRRQRKKEAIAPADAVAELGSELTQGLLADDELGAYDKVSVSLRNEKGETTSIAADNLRDVFTYPVSDGRPDEIFFYTKVSERLDTIALQEGIEVDPLDPVEVSECLEDSA
ncbi:MAG: hypothetical protein JWP56_1809 [Aeromicrobium sp.]|nr:hypothetical protein [Aeromicrobium sp.]